jgi:hypothetical protein
MAKRAVQVLLGVLLVLGVAGSAAAGVDVQTADVVGQGPTGPLVSPDGARLTRTNNGLSGKVDMPTPQPGTYTYPSGAEEGHPEAFTLWAFVFNFPGLCTPLGAPVCDADDLGATTAAKGGAFFLAGHPVGGPRVILSGHVSVGEDPFIDGHATLENPSGALVRLAVAPHGALDPELLPGQIKSPIGDASHWWHAVFIP